MFCYKYQLGPFGHWVSAARLDTRLPRKWARMTETLHQVHLYGWLQSIPLQGLPKYSLLRMQRLWRSGAVSLPGLFSKKCIPSTYSCRSLSPLKQLERALCRGVTRLDGVSVSLASGHLQLSACCPGNPILIWNFYSYGPPYSEYIPWYRGDSSCQ